MSPLRAAPLFVALGAALASCRQIAGIDDRSVGVDCSGVDTGASACGACVRTSCCDEALRCADDPSCKDLSRCLTQCAGTDEACRSACRSIDPSRLTTAAAALLACESVHCEADCGLQCGGYVYPRAECAACSAASCCAEARSCARSSECLALSYCLHACASNDTDCIGDCERKHGEGLAASSAFSQCIVQNDCLGICGDPAWRCLDQKAQPPTAVGMLTLSLLIDEPATNVPAQGVELTVCNKFDIECVSPVTGPKTTDAMGMAAFQVMPGFDGYVELRRPDGTVSLLFIGRPMLRDFGVAFTGDAKLIISLLDAIGAHQPDTGYIVVQPWDCFFNPGNGVAVSIDEPTATPWYMEGGLPTTGATQTGPDGVAGFLNVPAGKSVHATMILASTKQVVGTIALAVRDGAVTFELYSAAQ